MHIYRHIINQRRDTHHLADNKTTHPYTFYRTQNVTTGKNKSKFNEIVLVLFFSPAFKYTCRAKIGILPPPPRQDMVVQGGGAHVQARH